MRETEEVQRPPMGADQVESFANNADWETTRTVFNAAADKLLVRPPLGERPNWWVATAMPSKDPSKPYIFVGPGKASMEDDGLWDLVVGFYPDVSPADAAAMLRRLAQWVEVQTEEHWTGAPSEPYDGLDDLPY